MSDLAEQFNPSASVPGSIDPALDCEAGTGFEKVEIGNAVLYRADCLDVLKVMPENSVDLIATDPPYFRVKDEEWDNQWKSESDFLGWIVQLCKEWQRVLRPNGSLYVFASPQMAGKIEVEMTRFFNVLNHITWVKGQVSRMAGHDVRLRGFVPMSERCLFAEHFGDQYADNCSDLRGFVYAPVVEYLRNERNTAKMRNDEIDAACGWKTKAFHFFAQSGSNFCMPTAENYKCLREAMPGRFCREYEDLRREYEDLRRPFKATQRDQHTDVWTFAPMPGDAGRHPCEKPVPMMRHIIEVSSRPGAVVLDCFNGSGATGAAAYETGRKYIGIEKDPHWFKYGSRRIEEAQKQMLLCL